MPRRFLQVALPAMTITIALGMSVSAHGQSVADIARANRDKQNGTNPVAAQPVVITNDDLDALPSGGVVQRTGGTVASNKTPHVPAGQAPIDEHLAAQWKKQILAQQDKLATLQGRIDQLNAAIHPAGTAEFNGPYTRAQTIQQERLAEVQLQFNEQKKKLAEMQEEARRQGMHTTVYDP